MKLWPEICLRSLAASVFAALIALGFGIYRYQDFTRRLSAWQAAEAETKSHDVLETPVTLPGGKLKLADFGALVTKVSGLAVAFEDRTIAAEKKVGEPAAIVVRVPKGTLPLRTALLAALEPLDLAADLRGGTIHITTVDASIERNRLVAAVYPLPQPDPAGMGADDWFLAVVGFATQYNGHVETVPGALVVVTTEHGHHQIRSMIDAICCLEDGPRVATRLPPPPPGNVEQHILAALQKTADFDLQAVSLADAVDQLSRQYQIPIVLAQRQLKEAGLSNQSPVSKSVTDIPLAKALAALLKELDLTYVVRNNALRITTPDDAESELRFTAYPVHDLISSASASERQELVKLITSVVSPHSWDDLGGPGCLCRAGEGWLLVAQTQEIHNQIAALLGDLRQALTTTARPVGESWPVPSDTEAKIRRALEQRLPVNIAQTPLRDAVASLGHELDIPIALNAKTLPENGVRMTTAVGCRLPAGPASLQLQMLLDPLDLTFVVRDDVLQVTTPADAQWRLETRLFNVRPLFGAIAPLALQRLIAQAVDPNSWDEVGGPGSMLNFRGVLLVSQTAANLDETARLLTALQEICVKPQMFEPLPSGIPLVASAARDQLAAKLSSRADIELTSMLLADALRKLSDEQQVSIVADWTASLRWDAFGPPFASALSEHSLAGAFDNLLAPFEWGWMIRENVVYVTSVEEVESRPEIRLYNLDHPGANSVPATRLRDRLRQEFPEFSAKQRGRPAVLPESTVQLVQPDWLVIRASQPTHRRIEAWLIQECKVAGTFRVPSFGEPNP